MIVAVSALSTVSAYYYKGTGFSHTIPESKYSSMTVSDILSQYSDTDCNSEVSGTCTKVVDGDTIYVSGVGKVRFVGVNTPERGVEGYNTSKNFVKKLCLDKTVSLDIDDSKNKDKYGRTLAVVIVDGKNLNQILLDEGLAEIMYIPPSEFNPYSWQSDSSSTYNFIGTCDSTLGATYSFMDNFYSFFGMNRNDNNNNVENTVQNNVNDNVNNYEILSGTFSTASSLSAKTYCTVNIGTEHAGENLQISVLYSRDGSNLNHGIIVPKTVSSQGNLKVASKDAFKYYPDHALITVYDKSGNTLTTKEVNMDPSSGSQSF